MVSFTMEEIEQFTVEGGLHQALLMKFSHNKPDMQELNKILPKYFGSEGRCLIGWLARRQILVRFDRMEDYVMPAAKSVHYLLYKGEQIQIRIFPWSLGFNPKEETTRAFVWISLPSLPPVLFAKRFLLSIATAVGKPIEIDKATQEKTRPSTARVKVELDLLDKLPHRSRVQYLDEKSRKMVEDFQEIVYDNRPAYCNFCKHQAHNESLSSRFGKGRQNYQWRGRERSK